MEANQNQIIMKNSVFLMTLICIIIFSCSDDDNNQAISNPELIGTWELIEIYGDPGDGSGDFETVESNKTVEFRSDGTIVSNGTLCHPSIASDSPSFGTYSMADATINVADCTNSPAVPQYEIDGSKLTISYVCVESCQEKYIKVM